MNGQIQDRALVARHQAAGAQAADVHGWWEWERASHGRRQIAWSKGLREWANLGQEQTDEEIADEQLEAEDVLFIEPDSWRQMRGSPVQVCNLLEATEDGGYPAAMAGLTVTAWATSSSVCCPHRPPPRDSEHWRLRRDRLSETQSVVAGLAHELSESQAWRALLRRFGMR